MNTKKIIYQAKKILTMNPSQPQAEYIAIDGDMIRMVGPLEAMQQLQGYTLNTQFKDKILLPGFVEGHSHIMTASMWQYTYVGYFGRYDLDKKYWQGVVNYQQLTERLQQADSKMPAGVPMFVWGFDPIFFDGERLNRHHLDTMVSNRPVFVMHASFHIATINTKMLEMTNIAKNPNLEGVILDNSGVPNGELQELSAMSHAFSAMGNSAFRGNDDPEIYRLYAKSAKNVGITTITDLYNPLGDKMVCAMQKASEHPDFCVRLLPAMSTIDKPIEQGIHRLHACIPKSTKKLKFGLAKVMTDGSIQGFTARIKFPGYHNSKDVGIWNAPPETLHKMIIAYHQAGIQMHIHTNGDEATELAIDAIEQAMILWPNADHRHTLQHCQIIDHAQMKRVAKLGIGLNMFINHIYYWGDIHRHKTLGYERSLRLEPMASAKRLHIPTSIHSDSPITPLNPLFSVWCAVCRKTASGHVLGTHEAISVQQALESITIDSAYLLHMDTVIGSLESGKYADITILDEDPTAVCVDDIPHITICATVVGGDIYEV